MRDVVITVREECPGSGIHSSIGGDAENQWAIGTELRLPVYSTAQDLNTDGLSMEEGTFLHGLSDGHW